MEKLIKLLTNGKTVDEQTNLVANMMELAEFAGVTLVCMVVLAFMSIF